MVGKTSKLLTFLLHRCSRFDLSPYYSDFNWTYNLNNFGNDDFQWSPEATFSGWSTLQLIQLRAKFYTSAYP